MEITHEPDHETGHWRQVVPAWKLRDILRKDGDTLDRPDWFDDDDEWNVDDE